MLNDFDVIVIGSGAGGGSFAYACAVAGKSVLLIEKGKKYVVPGEAHDEKVMLIEKKPYDEREVRVNGRPHRLYTGGVLGGGTALYGAALMRPSAKDFHPGEHYGGRIPRAIWDWPVAYADLEPHYTEAERLYGVAGCCDDDFGPLQKPRHGFPQAAIPVRPINRRLMKGNSERGLKPFRLPLAINFQVCRRCHVCPGYICPNGARRSSAHLVEAVAVPGARLQVKTDVEAEAFHKNADGQVNGVQVFDRKTGTRAMYRAKRYALAAGAIGSPALLLRSGFAGSIIGRNYMYHVAPIVAGVFPSSTGADATFTKQVGFADYYFGTKRFSHKLGIIQSLPVPGPLMMARSGMGRLPSGMVQALRKRMLPLVGIVEDLPSPANQVSLGRDGTVELRHAFSAYDLQRGQYLSALMGRILKSTGALFCVSRPFPSEEHVAHQCGTLRFGKSPADAVLDPDCRMFSQPNVFVVDGSVFPTSLGVGPALTIIANALRVAKVVLKEI